MPLHRNIKAKQPESGDLCGNITEFGVAEEHLSPLGEGDLRPPQMKYTRLRLFCFCILLFNGFKSFQAKIYEINMYLLLNFIFLNYNLGIHPTST